MAAIISGPVLASLFYEQRRCPGDQEGLLIGKVQHSVRDIISDSQINNYKEEIKLYVYSCHEFQRETTQKRHEQLKKCIGEQIEKHGDECIVGWYHSRRNTEARLSLRERNTHHAFLQALPPQRREHFYFLLCTTSNTHNRSTHNYDFTFHKLHKTEARFVKVPITVINLEDTTTDSYKVDSSCTASSSSGIYASVISQFRSEILDKSGEVEEVKKISRLGSALQYKLQDLTRDVNHSEMELYALEQEVGQRRKLMEARLQEERKTKPIPLITKVTAGDPVSVAKQKREQRRRESNKALHPSLSSGRPSSSTKTKGDQAHPLSRRLSAELEEPKPSHSRHLSDDIAFIDEDIPEVVKQDKMDSGTSAEVKQKENSMQNGSSSVGHFEGPGVILVPHTGQSVRLTLPEPRSLESVKQTLPQTAAANQSKIKNTDHFSFVSGLLAEEKTKSVKSKSTPPTTSHNHADSMSVLVGGHMTAPPKTTSQVTAAVCVATMGNKDADDSTRRSSRLQKHQLTTSTALNVKGQRSRTKPSSRSRSREKTETSTSLDIKISSNSVSNHEQGNPGSSNSACRYEAAIDNKYEDEETDDVHKLTDHGQMDSFQISSSPVF